MVRRKHWLAFVSLGIIWGTTWVASGALAESVPPLRGAAVRFLLAALILIPLIVWKRLTVPRGRALGFVLWLSVAMIVLPLLLLLWVQQHVSSATITVLYAAMPLLVSVLTPGGVPSGAMQAATVGLGAMVLVVSAGFSVAQAGGAAVVCPGTALETGKNPPVRALLDKGVAVALGSDHTPGGNGITSMPLVISLAVSQFGLSVTEALRAATLGGAQALRAPDRGAMVRGRLADIVLWDADHEGAFAWSYGLKPSRVWLGGAPVAS